MEAAAVESTYKGAEHRGSGSSLLLEATTKALSKTHEAKHA